MLETWQALVLVAVGGAVGGALRYAVSGLVGKRVGETYPWGTLAVNTSGAFALGLLVGMYDTAAAVEQTWWLALGVGLLGSYTTVSSLSLQALLLAHDGQRSRAAGYVALSLLVGAVAVVAGFWISAA